MFTYNQPLYFKGSMTQLTACEQLRVKFQDPTICTGTDYDPVTGFVTLYNKIKTDQYTGPGNLLKWASDMSNFNLP